MISNRRLQFWLSLLVLFFLFIFMIRSVLLPFVLGILTAYFLDPAVDRLERFRLSRGVATFVVTAVFFTAIITLSVFIFPIIVSQLAGLISSLPEYMRTLEQNYSKDITAWLRAFPMLQIDNVQTSIANFSSVVISFTERFFAHLFQSSMAIVNMFSLLLITPVVAFYMLRDWDILVARLDSYLPRSHADTIRAQLSIIDVTLAGFIRGQLNVCLILGIYYAACLSALGLKFGFLIGAMTGLLVIIPYVGALFGTCVGLAVAFFQFPTYDAIGVMLAVFLVGQALEGYMLTPRLVGKRVGLHPVWIIFGMLAGGALFGFVGVLLAVPVSAVVGVLIRFALERYLASSYYGGEAKI